MTNVGWLFIFSKNHHVRVLEDFMKFALIFSSKKKNSTYPRRFQKFVKAISPRLQNVGFQTVNTNQFSQTVFTQ